MNAHAIQRLLQEADPEVLELARSVSPAVWVEPALLREARLHFFPQMSASVEGRLWNSALIESTGTDAIILLAPILKVLREQLAKETDRFNRSLELIRSHHQTHAYEFRLEEEAIAAALQDDVAEVDRLFREFEPFRERKSVQRWAARALPRMPTGIRNSRSAKRLAIASIKGRDSIFWTESEGGQQEGFEADYDRLSEVPVHLRRTGDALLLGDVSGPDTVAILVPDLSPVQLELTWEDLGKRTTETLQISADETSRRFVGSGSLRVKTLSGKVYEIPDSRPSETDSEHSLVDLRYDFEAVLISEAFLGFPMERLASELRELDLRVWSSLEATVPEINKLPDILSSCKVLIIGISSETYYSDTLKQTYQMHQRFGANRCVIVRFDKAELPPWAEKESFFDWNPEETAFQISTLLREREQKKADSIYAGHTGPVSALCLDPSSGDLYSGSETGQVFQWNRKGDREAIRSSPENDMVTGIARSPIDMILISTADGKLLPTTSFSRFNRAEFTNPIVSIAYSERGGAASRRQWQCDLYHRCAGRSRSRSQLPSRCR